MTKFYVYEHWRLDRDECFYVGNRAYWMHDRNLHHRAIQAKLSREGSAIEVLIVASGLSAEQACALEAERAAFWRSAGVDLANIMVPGPGGRMAHATASKERMSRVRSGKKRGPHLPEHRAKIAAALMGHPGSKAQTGRVRTDETKEKLRKAQFQPEIIAAWAERAKAGPAAMARRVLCLDDGKTYESASAAARAYGVAKSALIELCLGRKYRRSVGGRRFKYEDA
jgi:hypothetical protein